MRFCNKIRRMVLPDVTFKNFIKRLFYMSVVRGHPESVDPAAGR